MRFVVLKKRNGRAVASRISTHVKFHETRILVADHINHHFDNR
jgi:hypothetical protein